MNGNGRVALVTGASSGIGRATAVGLVKAGYKVWGNSRQVGAAQGQAFDTPLDLYREVSTGVDRRVKEVLVTAEAPDVVAKVVVKAALATHPKLRYAPGQAARLRLLRRFMPARLLDAGVRRDLRLQA